MEFGGYILIAILMVGGVFFTLSIYNRDNIRVLKFTALGLATLALSGLIIMVSLYSSSKDLKVAVSTLIILAVFYLWFYRGSVKDRLRGKD